jgi:NADH-quinone oxidoreductase subunit F
MVDGHGTESDIDTLLDVCDNVLGRSFCALGDGAVSPITSGIKYFRDEFLALCESNKRGKHAKETQLVGARS